MATKKYRKWCETFNARGIFRDDNVVKVPIDPKNLPSTEDIESLIKNAYPYISFPYLPDVTEEIVTFIEKGITKGVEDIELLVSGELERAFIQVFVHGKKPMPKKDIEKAEKWKQKAKERREAQKKKRQEQAEAKEKKQLERLLKKYPDAGK